MLNKLTSLINKVFIGSLFVCLFSSPSLAHVKWFIPLDGSIDPSFVRYSLGNTAVIVWIVIAIFLISTSVFLDSKLPSLPKDNPEYQRIAVLVLSICTGISLLLTAFSGSVIAPHYHVDSTFMTLLLIVEVIIGVLLCSTRFAFHAGLLLLVLYLGVAILFGFVETIEYWNMLGVAAFLLFNNIKNPHYRQTLQPYAVPALRISTGIALITLGLSEKLLSAEYGEAFVDKYQWNFMQNVGVEFFSDRLFVLSAGFMEVVFGIILIIGTTTRLNILVVSGFMLTSNITFFVEGNITQATVEIIGHLPVIAIAVICIFFGSGQKLTIKSLFKRWLTSNKEYNNG